MPEYAGRAVQTDRRACGRALCQATQTGQEPVLDGEATAMALHRIFVRRRTWGMVVWAAMLTFAAVWPSGRSGAAQRPAPSRDPADSGVAGSEQQMSRVREGALLDTTGYFKVTGDRALFTTADGSARFTGLENLNLERIAIAVSESPDPLLWSVTGTVTEFRGTNYLLVTRALLKNKPAAPKGAVERAAPKKNEKTAG